jgi:midasin
VNEPALTILHGNEPNPQAIQFGRFQDVELNVYELRQALGHIIESSSTFKPSEMTLLQRSMASDKIPSLSKDPTQPVSGFLLSCISALFEFLSSLDSSHLGNASATQIPRDILKFCWDLVRLTQRKTLDVGVFQTYLQIGQSLFSNVEASYPPLDDLKTSLSHYLGRFGETWNLTTGLSMQRLWDRWRPATPTDLEHLRSMIELETLASRFDSIIFKAQVPLSQLSHVRSSLLDAQTAMLASGVDGELLVKVIPFTHLLK